MGFDLLCQLLDLLKQVLVGPGRSSTRNRGPDVGAAARGLKFVGCLMGLGGYSEIALTDANAAIKQSSRGLAKRAQGGRGRSREVIRRGRACWLVEVSPSSLDWPESSSTPCRAPSHGLDASPRHGRVSMGIMEEEPSKTEECSINHKHNERSRMKTARHAGRRRQSCDLIASLPKYASFASLDGCNSALAQGFANQSALEFEAILIPTDQPRHGHVPREPLV